MKTIKIEIECGDDVCWSEKSGRNCEYLGKNRCNLFFRPLTTNSDLHEIRSIQCLEATK